MSRVVLDCSVTLSWCFEDQADSTSDALLDALDETEAIAPAIWPLELANALLVAERHGRLSAADGSRFLQLVGGLPILVEDLTFSRATGAVLATARQTKLSSYDAAYLELAMRTGASLATRDRGLRRAARRLGVELYA
ncbi:MAG: type II toxin-antitoxin system VapC family toxin [Acidobacteriota bacterium]|nr:type II toxin-antitoxin system VapC family toxin [Acidobacteriota bacterium]MDH3524680.1 type II toxin-antitoxin system VapC family toxin [Acidobacteriota bacterium]